MEENKLNLEAPFLSVRRIPTKPENSSESENTKNKTTTARRRKVKDSCQETEHETLVRLLQDDQSSDHAMEPSLVPFLWEQATGNPKDHHTLIEESDLIKALEMVSSTASFSVNCSTNGASDELEKDGDRSSKVSKDDVILEYRDLIMSRFLPAAKAMAMKQKKEYSLDQEEKMKKKKKQSITLQRVSMAINQDLNNDDNDHNHVDETVYPNYSKKAMFGFIPQFCSKNSLDVLNPVLSRVRTCQNLAVKPGNVINPRSQDSVYKTKSASSPRILRSIKVMGKSHELSQSAEIVGLPRHPLRLQRTSSGQIKRQDTMFLAEGVKRMRNKNKTRSDNLSVSQPPLPKTPSESWLCRTLSRISTSTTVFPGQFAVIVSGQATGLRKIEQKTSSQSIKWETIVKTSYKHHDHARYSEELTVVHPFANTNHEPGPFSLNRDSIFPV